MIEEMTSLGVYLMRAIYVLLSTYNGEKYLDEQLATVIGQRSSMPVELLVRDDGSHDSTSDILRNYADHDSHRVFVEYGTNVGVIDSFLTLLRQAPDRGYYAFCDQDDLWHADKLERAIAKLAEVPVTVPALYCSRTELVDHEGRKIGEWPPIPPKPVSFENALVENVVVGCTVVINEAAKRLITERLPNPDRIIMHDWWLYLCVSAFGEVIFDSVPSIGYRQHGGNAIGGEAAGLRKWTNKLAKLKTIGTEKKYRIQAGEFLRLYEKDLNADKLNSLRRFLDSDSTLAKRLAYALAGDAYRQSQTDHLLFRVLYALHRI